MKNRRKRSGFLLIEVLVALAIFGLCATTVLSSAFDIMRFLGKMKDTRERDQALQFARSEVLSIADRDKLEEGGEINTLGLGSVEWTLEELEMTDLLDVYKVTVLFQWEGNEETQEGEREIIAHVLRTTWTTEDFQTERISLRTEKALKIDEMRMEQYQP